MESIEKKAYALRATDFGKSTRKNKRYFVNYMGKIIHFGDPNGKTFIDHKDINKRNAWRARHSKILLKSGKPAYLNKRQPAFWSYHLLWT